MKKQVVVVMAILCTILVTPRKIYAQSKDDIFKPETPLTWLGVDFSEARYFGDVGTVSPYEMKNLFNRINYVVVSEPDKYNLPKSFNKFSVTPNLQAVDEINQNIDQNKILSFNYAEFTRMNPEFIQSMVDKYNFRELTGTAVVMIVEGLSKSSEQASIWVVYINTGDHKVIHAARLLGKAGGFGFRNHWATPIYNVLKSIRSKEYKQWQKAAGAAKKI